MAVAPEFREFNFFAQALQTLQVITETDPKFHSGAEGMPKWPQAEPLGSPSRRKGTDQHPKGAKDRPEVSQEKQDKVQRDSKERNKSQNYMYLNTIYARSRYTAMQRPATNKSSVDLDFDLDFYSKKRAGERQQPWKG